MKMRKCLFLIVIVAGLIFVNESNADAQILLERITKIFNFATDAVKIRDNIVSSVGNDIVFWRIAEDSCVYDYQRRVTASNPNSCIVYDIEILDEALLVSTSDGKISVFTDSASVFVKTQEFQLSDAYARIKRTNNGILAISRHNVYFLHTVNSRVELDTLDENINDSFKFIGTSGDFGYIVLAGGEEIDIYRQDHNTMRLISKNYGWWPSSTEAVYCNGNTVYIGGASNEIRRIDLEVDGSWKSKTLRISDSFVTDGLIYNGYHIYITEQGGVFAGKETLDDSIHTEYHYNIPINPTEREDYRKVRLFNDTLLVSSHTGITIFKISVQPLICEKFEDENVVIFPNPFANNLSIQYSLYHRAMVSIKLYTSFGMEIETTGPMEMLPGNHKYSVNRLFTAGIYFYMIQIGDKRLTGKIICYK